MDRSSPFTASSARNACSMSFGWCDVRILIGKTTETLFLSTRHLFSLIALKYPTTAFIH